MLPPRRVRLRRAGPEVASEDVKALRGTKLGASIVAACSIVVVSGVIGVVWGLLAPAEHDLVLSPEQTVPLTGESLHRFDATAMFACAGLIVGIVSAAGVWAFRRSRGPLTFGGVVVGSAAGAALMAAVGMGVAALRFPEPSAAQPGEVIALAPGVGTVVVLVFQPLAACLVTLTLAALNPYDDLGVSGDEHASPSDGWPESGELVRDS